MKDVDWPSSMSQSVEPLRRWDVKVRARGGGSGVAKRVVLTSEPADIAEVGVTVLSEGVCLRLAG